MAAVGAYDPQVANRVLPPSTASASSTPAAPQGAARQAGFSGKSSFDPVESTINGSNSQASSRAGLAQGNYRAQEGILAKSNSAWSWHQLRKELISLMRPS
jgi:hypothetical protein